MATNFDSVSDGCTNNTGNADDTNNIANIGDTNNIANTGDTNNIANAGNSGNNQNNSDSKASQESNSDASLPEDTKKKKERPTYTLTPELQKKLDDFWAENKQFEEVDCLNLYGKAITLETEIVKDANKKLHFWKEGEFVYSFNIEEIEAIFPISELHAKVISLKKAYEQFVSSMYKEAVKQKNKFGLEVWYKSHIRYLSEERFLFIVNKYDNDLGNEILQESIKIDFLEGAHFAIEKLNADVISHDKDGYEPLWYAINNKSIAAMQLLLNTLRWPNDPFLYPNHYRDPNSLMLQSYIRPLQAATKIHFLDGMSLLLEKKADPNNLDGFSNKTALQYAVETKFQEGIKLLLNNGANINYVLYQYPNGTLFHKAVEIEDCECLELLLEKFSDLKKSGAVDNNLLDFQDKYGKTALHYAAEKRWYKVIKLLLAHGANPNLLDKEGNTALSSLLVPKNLASIVLSANVNDIYSIDPDQLDAKYLEEGAEFKELEECSLLLIEKMDQNHLNACKFITPLGLAIFLGYTNIAKHLIARGANVNQISYKNDYNQETIFTPLYMALSSTTPNSLEWVKLLFENGARLNAKEDLVQLVAKVIPQKNIEKLKYLYLALQRENKSTVLNYPFTFRKKIEQELQGHDDIKRYTALSLTLELDFINGFEYLKNRAKADVVDSSGISEAQGLLYRFREHEKFIVKSNPQTYHIFKTIRLAVLHQKTAYAKELFKEILHSKHYIDFLESCILTQNTLAFKFATQIMSELGIQISKETTKELCREAFDQDLEVVLDLIDNPDINGPQEFIDGDCLVTHAVRSGKPNVCLEALKRGKVDFYLPLKGVQLYIGNIMVGSPSLFAYIFNEPSFQNCCFYLIEKYKNSKDFIDFTKGALNLAMKKKDYSNFKKLFSELKGLYQNEPERFDSFLFETILKDFELHSSETAKKFLSEFKKSKDKNFSFIKHAVMLTKEKKLTPYEFLVLLQCVILEGGKEHDFPDPKELSEIFGDLKEASDLPEHLQKRLQADYAKTVSSEKRSNSYFLERFSCTTPTIDLTDDYLKKQPKKVSAMIYCYHLCLKYFDNIENFRTQYFSHIFSQQRTLVPKQIHAQGGQLMTYSYDSIRPHLNLQNPKGKHAPHPKENHEPLASVVQKIDQQNEQNRESSRVQVVLAI